jgi:hypothetical protein
MLIPLGVFAGFIGGFLWVLGFMVGLDLVCFSVFLFRQVRQRDRQSASANPLGGCLPIADHTAIGKGSATASALADSLPMLSLCLIVARV